MPGATEPRPAWPAPIRALHFREYLPFGLFFVGAGIAQVALAGAILMVPTRRLFLAGAVGTLGLIALWLRPAVQEFDAQGGFHDGRIERVHTINGRPSPYVPPINVREGQVVASTL